MHLAIAETGEQGSRKMIPLCLIEAENPSAGLDKLKELLRQNGIETEPHFSRWLKWEHTIFHVREIGGEDDLGRMLKAVHAAESHEAESTQRFIDLLHANP